MISGTSQRPVRLGLLGCGTVGGGVVKLLTDNAKYLGMRVGAPLEIARVLVRDEKKERVPELDRALVTTDPELVLGDDTIDVIVETMGGLDPAREWVERAIENKKSVVTANKALLAAHGPDLVERAHAAGVDLAFEGSVGGGIPIIRTLREAFASDWVQSLTGIVNGTCNYVLTRMNDAGLSFDEAVKEAQNKGYAEADPELDVGGHDAAHKLVVLAMLAFGARIDSKNVPTEGIRAIEPIDHRLAKRFGYVIKHLAVGRDAGEQIELRVHPALIAQSTPLANVSGPCMLSGRGAGDMPTAVSVVADVLDVARALRSGVPGLMTRGIQMQVRKVVPIEELRSRYFLRFNVENKPGVLARIALALGDAGVTVEQMVQEEAPSGVHVVMTTHQAIEKELRKALNAIAAQSFVVRPTQVIRVVG